MQKIEPRKRLPEQLEQVIGNGDNQLREMPATSEGGEVHCRELRENQRVEARAGVKKEKKKKKTTTIAGRSASRIAVGPAQ